VKPSFLSIALTQEVIIVALKMALIVGTILGLINHGNGLIEGTLTSTQVLQIIITYSVPYCVSTYSSVKAIQKRTLE
jgi:hypothetical protein